MARSAKEPRRTEDTVERGEATTRAEVDPKSLVDKPGEQGGLAGPGEGAALPVAEALEPTAGLVTDGPVQLGVEDPGARALHDPGDVVGDGAHAGLSSEMEGLEDLLAGEGGYGGADGRNDASDAGGPGNPDAEAPDFGAGSPVHPGGWHGLDGAAGKLGDWQQAYVDKLNEQMKAAQADGDYEKAEKIADQVHQFVAAERGETVAPEPTDGGAGGDGGAADNPYEMTSNFGSGAHGATKQVWNKQTGEMEEVPADTKTGSTGFITEGEQMKQTGTDASGNQETPTPSTTPPQAEDREWEGEAPDLHGDFIDEYHQQQTGADGGGDVDPDPNADAATGVMDGDPGDHEPYVAEYEPGTEITEDQIDAAAGRIDPVPDEEFLDV